jgi:hypothetical protein
MRRRLAVAKLRGPDQVGLRRDLRSHSASDRQTARVTAPRSMPYSAAHFGCQHSRDGLTVGAAIREDVKTGSQRDGREPGAAHEARLRASSRDRERIDRPRGGEPVLPRRPTGGPFANADNRRETCDQV